MSWCVRGITGYCYLNLIHNSFLSMSPQSLLSYQAKVVSRGFRKKFRAWVGFVLFSVVCFKFILITFFFKNCLKLSMK